MNLLETLTRAADEEQLRLQPLPEHAIAAREEHLRRHYALLLAAALTAQPTISEPQTRLLRLLLDSLELGDIRGPLFEQARALEPETLLEAARLIREAGFAHHLVVDALVLLRLDTPLCDEVAHLVGELAAFLGLDETALATRAQDAADILGLNLSKKAEEDGCTDVSEKAEGAEQGTEPLPLQAELWPSRLRQALTAAALRNGLQGGLWLLDANLDVDFPWQANDAILIFRKGAILNTFAKEGEIKLTDCRLVDALLDFQGACRITLERCNWQGNYDQEAERTTLNSDGQALTVIDCQFSTRNAQAIAVQNNALTLTGTRFTRCGHPDLNGGAVWHSNHERAITDCRFDHCLAARGGAIWVSLLAGIDQSEFVACESRALQDLQAGDVAVFAERNLDRRVLTRCVFRRTSANVGDSYAFSGRHIAVDCQFIQGNLFCHRGGPQNIGLGSSFDGGRIVEKNFEKN